MLESIGRIIVPTDFSDLSEIALRSAATLGKPDDASVYLLHVIRLPFLHTNYDVNIPEAIWENIRRGTQEHMAASRRVLEEAGVAEVNEVVSEALQPAEAVAKFAEELSADMVVMATHGRSGLRHSLVGSVTERTLRISPVPVLAVKGNRLEAGPVRRILLATDFSQQSKKATAYACFLAKRFGASIDVVHVLEEWPAYLEYASAEALDFESRARAIMGDRLESLVADIAREAIPVNAHLLKGNTADVIVGEADRGKSDLIVMATHGHRGLTHYALGSVTERTLRLAACSVLTTRGDAADSSEAG
jgi:nucleotide-binding universal stress UspA family protein